MRHKSAYKVLASQVLMVAIDDGSKRGYFCGERVFCALEVEVEVEGEDQ